VPTEAVELPVVLEAPQAHGLVIRARHDLRLVGRELGNVHSALVALERSQDSAAGQVKHLHNTSLSTGREELSVRTERPRVGDVAEA